MKGKEKKKYSLGIDLHKKFAYWTLQHRENVLWKGRVDNKKDEIISSLSLLPCSLEQITAIIEPVELWGWYADVLEEQGLEVLLVDTLQTANIIKSKKKNDKIDSQKLAQLHQSGFLPTAYLSPVKYRDLKELIRGRIFLVRIRTKIKNRIHTIFSKHGIFYTLSSDMFGSKGQEWIKSSINGLRSVYQIEIHRYLPLLDHITDEIKYMDNIIANESKKDSDVQLLMSIPGFGKFIALLVKTEIGTYSRFPKPEYLASYAGLVPNLNASANKTRLGHITKCGSRYLRWALIQAAQRVTPNWGYLYEFHKRVKERKGNMIAKVALARKLLTISWYLIKKQEPFNKEFLLVGNKGGMKQ